ncbi:MAG: FKBP-type peptidyl-prolyl cis-trans isomerase [Clostridia bacterium]|nr:FKBP-type peptidyl-prolyl cis-trans isomerase [Clostridia bacterium]
MKKIISFLIAVLMIAALTVPILAESEQAESASMEATVSADASEGTDAPAGEEIPDEKADAESEEDGEDVITVGAESEGGEEAAPSSAEGTVVSVEGAPDYVVKSDDYYMNYKFDAVFDENGHFKDVRALDYVELKNYEKLVISRADLDTKVKERIDAMLENYGTPSQLTEGTVKDADTVNIDYTGYIDGEAFEGGSTDGNGSTVTIGESPMIDGFLEQIVGHNVGETFDINVTFPEDYGNEELAGKDAVFTITINYIEGDKDIPELTDEFVSANITPQAEDIKTAQDLLDYYEERVKQDLIADKLVEENEVKELPSFAYDFAVDLTIIPYANYASQYGVDIGTLLTVYGLSIEDMISDFAEDNLKVAKRMLIVQAIDESRDDISVTEDDMKAFATENFGSEDYSEAVDSYGEGLLKMYVLQDVVMKHVTDNSSFEGEGVGTKSIIIAACVAGGAVLLIALVLIIKNVTKKKEGISAADAAINGTTETAPEDGETPSMINVAELLGGENADEAAEGIKEAAEETAETAEQIVDEAVEEVKETVEEAAEAAEETAEDIEKAAEDAKEEAENAVEDITEE